MPRSALSKPAGAPPAIAGTMDRMSPSTTGESSPFSCRTSSSFRNRFTNLRISPRSSQIRLRMPGHSRSRLSSTCRAVAPATCTESLPRLRGRSGVGILTVTGMKTSSAAKRKYLNFLFGEDSTPEHPRTPRGHRARSHFQNQIGPALRILPDFLGTKPIGFRRSGRMIRVGVVHPNDLQLPGTSLLLEAQEFGRIEIVAMGRALEVEIGGPARARLSPRHP